VSTNVPSKQSFLYAKPNWRRYDPRQATAAPQVVFAGPHVMRSSAQDYGLHDVRTRAIAPFHMYCAVRKIRGGTPDEALLVALLLDLRIRPALPVHTSATCGGDSSSSAVQSAHKLEI
jgi:hypothetical protein